MGKKGGPNRRGEVDIACGEGNTLSGDLYLVSSPKSIQSLLSILIIQISNQFCLQ